jgi:hypothetical protein
LLSAWLRLIGFTTGAIYTSSFTAYSHGWVVLAPNAWDEQRHAVQRVQRLDDGKVVHLDISGRVAPEEPEIGSW